MSDGTLKYLLMVIQKISPKKVLNLCFNLTKDSAVQWYQYRILHRIIPVKIYLKKIKAANNDDDCTFCGISSETIEHIFISYSHSLAMWNHFNIHLFNTSAERIGFIISKCYFWRLSSSKHKHGCEFPYIIWKTIHFLLF